MAPNVSYGDELEPGRNAFAANKKTSTGANFQVMNVDETIPAEGNQWEHCGSGAVCDIAVVQAQDIYSSPSGAMVDIGLPPSPRAGTPVLSRVSPARPQADATGEHDFWPDAVTPTMLAFRMPFDCFAPLTLEVAKRDPSGSRVAATMPLCDPKGCMDEPAGTPCDDGNACTVNDACDGSGN